MSKTASSIVVADTGIVVPESRITLPEGRETDGIVAPRGIVVPDAEGGWVALPEGGSS